MTEELTIRPMRTADLPQVLTVERACHPHPWSKDLFLAELDNPCSTVDLLWQEGRLAGYICSWYLHRELHILNVATAPPFRRRGVARTLLNHALHRARRQGLEKAFLEVRTGNRGAIALYEAAGFRRIARRPRYYPDGEDAWVMELKAEG